MFIIHYIVIILSKFKVKPYKVKQTLTMIGFSFVKLYKTYCWVVNNKAWLQLK